MNELEKLKRLLVDDLHSLLELTFTSGPLCDRHVRQASVIVRRWLLDNDLAKLTGLLRATATFPVQDDKHLFEAVKRDPEIDFYLSAGLKLNSRPVMQLYTSRASLAPAWMEYWQTIPVVYVRLGKAVDRPVLFFEGEIFNRSEVLRFACNKLGGAHHDVRRDSREEKLERASKHLTIGPPADALSRGIIGLTHLPIEQDGADVLSAISIAVVVTAAMLVNIRFNGIPLLNLEGM